MPSNPRATMSHAAEHLAYQRACKATYDGTEISFTGPDGYAYTIQHRSGDTYTLQGPDFSAALDLSHMMGENNGVWLANAALAKIRRR